MAGATTGTSRSHRPSRSRSPRRSGAARSAGGPVVAAGRKEKDPIAQHVHHQEVPHFPVVQGQLLGPRKRYYVRRLLGEGTFGRVLSCVDTTKKAGVAVKVVKGVKRYCEYAEAEAEVLREIARCDPGKQSRCVQLLDAFLHPVHHYCLVFERLGVSLHEFMLKDCTHGLLVADVQRIAQQLLQCLCFLHGLQLTHTDLKCRNVMLRDARYELVPLPRAAKGQVMVRKPMNLELVVIDFGGALFAAERGDGKIGTRHYRAPEVVLGLPWDEKVDCWAAGCLVALAYLGQRPIGASEDFEQLALMERVLGAEFPRPMAREALSRGTVPTGNMFNKAGRLEWPKRAPDSEAAARVELVQPLKEKVKDHHHAVLELLEGLLQMDPRKRLSAESAAEQPFTGGATKLVE